MARFVDLDLEGDEDESLDRGKPLLVQNGRAMAELASQSAVAAAGPSSSDGGHGDEEKPRVVRNAVTEAFHCYPIVIAIVSRIDLNTLDALARTSRLIHDGLIQFRSTLLNRTLRCSKEYDQSEPTIMVSSSLDDGAMVQFEDGTVRPVRPKSGPVHCARDMVGECRRCGKVTCRNCAIKPPASNALLERHRRLCTVCSEAPIGSLASPPLDGDDMSLCSESVKRSFCQCQAQGVWLCQACGRRIRANDYEYKRLWRWRKSFGELVFGLGTGIGEGDRGVICGRGGACLAARDREYEIDCDAEDARDSANTPSIDSQPVSTPSTGEFPFVNYENGPIEALIDGSHRRNSPSPQLGPGYARHEIEGIGGVVKRKLIKTVRVGACVPEWQDERGGSASGGPGKMMAREMSGVSRSWCGWCCRAVPGRKDLDIADGRRGEPQ